MSFNHLGRSIPQSFYSSKRWKHVRDDYFDKMFGICERCEGAGYIVHHKEYLDMSNYRDASIAYGEDNLELLCIPCHNTEHFSSRESEVRDTLGFDSEGRLMQIKEEGKEFWEE